MLSVSVVADDPADCEADTVAVGFFEGTDVGHGLDALVTGGEAKAGLGKTALLHAGGKRWLAVGLGKAGEFDVERGRIAGGSAFGRAAELGAKALAWVVPEGAGAGGIVEGSVLASHPWSTWKSDFEDGSLVSLVVCGGDADEVAAAATMAAAVNVGRDLQNAPANEMTPTALATHARAVAAELGLTVEVLGREQLRAAGMGAFSAVAQGAAEEPQLITLRYSGPEAAGPVLGLVGKAVTFDTGGISLKPGAKMRAT